MSGTIGDIANQIAKSASKAAGQPSAQRRPHHPRPSRALIGDAFVPRRATSDQRVHARQQSFFKQAQTPTPTTGPFRNEEDLVASYDSARRTLGQNQNTDSNGGSSAGDMQQLTHKQREAIRVMSQRQQSEAQYRAQQARLRQQNANNTHVQQKTVDLSFSGQRLTQNYLDSTDWAKRQPGNAVQGVRNAVSDVNEWAFSSRSTANAQATETQLKQQRYDRKAESQNPQRARQAIRNRERADRSIASDANQETWDRREFEKSQADDRQAALDQRTMERFRLQHPDAYKRWQANERRNVGALYEASRPDAQDRVDAIADEKRREQTLLGDRSKTLLTTAPQNDARRKAEANIVDSGVRERQYDNESLNVVSFGVHDSSRRGDGVESAANLFTFGGGTSARNAGQAGGLAWEEHAHGNQLDAMGNHVDAQKMHQQSSDHTGIAAFESAMTVLSATGAGSLYTGWAKDARAARWAAQRQAMVSDMKPYPNERLTLRPAVNLERPATGPATEMRASGKSVRMTTPARGKQSEVYGPKPVKAEEVVAEWKRFLGDGPYSDRHPRTGEADCTRLVSADGKRSIRYGNHERNGSANKHHYHEETWSYDEVHHTMDCHNTVRRVPLNDTKSNAPKWPMED